MKRLSFTVRNAAPHWVGDGFPVRTMLSYSQRGAALSPFLLLDYAGPADFPPAEEPRGVEEHPHRGFETVTIVFAGEVEHRDSAGGGGRIGPGDVQWMTAAAGLVHEEMHGREFTRRGGTFEVIQLWVNLPAKHKADVPSYQGIAAEQIPSVELPDGGGTVRVIAGEFIGTRGAARTFTPLNLWDVRIRAGGHVELPLPAGHTSAVFVRQGRVRFGEKETIGGAELAAFDRDGEGIALDALADTTLLVLTGEPIDEPIAGAGPFVMNTQDEIAQAYADYRAGKMGRIANSV